MRFNMRSMGASDLGSSLLNKVWNRLNDASALGPQARAASVNSCCTAATWMAEISAALAQAAAIRASAKDALAKHRTVTMAPNFIPCIEPSSTVPAPDNKLNRIVIGAPSLWKAGTFQLVLWLYEPGTGFARFEEHALFWHLRICSRGPRRRARLGLVVPPA